MVESSKSATKAIQKRQPRKNAAGKPRSRGVYTNLAGVDIPSSLPKWDRQCEARRKRTEIRCKSRACIGSNVCRKHGGAAHAKIRLIKYLNWCVLGGNAGDHVVYMHLAVYATMNHLLALGKHATDEEKLEAGIMLLNTVGELQLPDE
jgi:hypothetical protein